MASSAMFVQLPSASLQESTVQATPSSQSTGVPAWQTPELQVSAPLQAIPSSHIASLEHPASGMPASMPASTVPASLVEPASIGEPASTGDPASAAPPSDVAPASVLDTPESWATKASRAPVPESTGAAPPSAQPAKHRAQRRNGKARPPKQVEAEPRMRISREEPQLPETPRVVSTVQQINDGGGQSTPRPPIETPRQRAAVPEPEGHRWQDMDDW